MPHPLPFDPNIYYSIVAKNLIRSLGSRALVYADIALQKMKTTNDTEGFDLWLGIHEHLCKQSNAEHASQDTIH